MRERPTLLIPLHSRGYFPNERSVDITNNVKGITNKDIYSNIEYTFDETDHYLNIGAFPNIRYIKADAYKTTSISVAEGEIYRITSRYGYAAALYGVVDANNKLLAIYPTEFTSGLQREIIEITIPEGGIQLIVGATGDGATGDISADPTIIEKKISNNLKVDIVGTSEVNGYKKLDLDCTSKYIDIQGLSFSFNDRSQLAMLQVAPGEKYRITGRYQYRTSLYVILDSKGHVLERKPTTYTPNEVIETIELTMPANATTLYAGSFEYDKQLLIVEKEMEHIKINSNILLNKKWTVCGDSFTAGDFNGYIDSEGRTGKDSDAYDPIEKKWKTYPWWIEHRNDMNIQWLAKGGADFTNIPNASSPFSNPNTTTYNYTQIAADSDYITFMYGLNEQNVTIGTNTDSDNTTLWGAYNVVLESVLTANPTVKIGIIISDAWLNQTYHDALIAIAKYWGIPYLDLKNGELVPMGLDGRLDETSPMAVSLRNNAFKIGGGNHPNVKAHEYRSTIIENFLRSL